ncbi:MAG: rRNA maturation RNase YbeY [Acidobacteria bacterium]|nr:rRNA maturation RNase YbeY [Acidobacteriota bacterium]
MILNQQRSVRVSSVQLTRFLLQVQRTLRLSKDSVAVCLVEDKEIARWNQNYRHKRGPTDVLSFPATSFPWMQKRAASRAKAHANGNSTFLGDIAISPAVARRNARSYGRTLSDELRILILHGVLHLLGYDHETDKGEMERYEARLRRRLGLEQ